MEVTKILIAEAEIILAKNIEKSLKDRGYNVIGVAASSNDAIKLMESNTADIVIIDTYLESGLDGIETAKEMSRRYPAKFIFISQYDDEDTFKRAKAISPANYLIKPFTIQQLLLSIVLAISEPEVVIAIPQEKIELSRIKEIQNSCENFMIALGFGIEAREEPIMGSFFQKLRFNLGKAETKAEIKEVYQKGKLALEVALLNSPMAEATEKLASAASSLISALDKYDEGALRLGALLVIKLNKDGKNILLVETISPQLVTVLDKSPSLLLHPKAIYDLLVDEKEK